MPRKKLPRRFDPRGGVSQTMVDAECPHVGQELDDYLVLSISELRQRLGELQTWNARSEEHLQLLLAPLPDRQRLALRCMLARDFRHIATLFETFLSSPESPR
jgi:hypothetical protein